MKFQKPNETKMKAKSNQNAKTEVCRQCLLIRHFSVTAIAIVLLSLIAGENTKFLGMFTPERASVAIVLGGALMASVKIQSRREGVKTKQNGLAVAHKAYPSADRERNSVSWPV